jgi:HEAT repeat protein
MTRRLETIAAFVWLLVSVGVVGCHADKDDPAGQAEELSDPVRRQNAISNLRRIYGDALADHGGDRSHPEVKKIADQIHEDLEQAYLNNQHDTQNALHMLEIMKTMQDPRTLDAFIAALDWRTEVTEEHAIRAAQALQDMEVPDDKKDKVIDALAKALRKVSGSRGIDNRMRINFLRALGKMEDPRATEVLADIATTQSEDQNFLINRLAAQQLGKIGDPEAIPALIKGLFLFAPSNPAMRMNDVASEALVRIGRPAYDSLLKVLKGEHEAANAIAKTYIEAVRKRDEAAASKMSVEDITSGEATFALGALGFPEAMEPLMAQIEADDISRRINAAIALVRLNHEAGDVAKVREAIQGVYEDAEVQAKPQLIAAARHLYDPKLLPFFLSQVKDTDLHPVVRLEGVKAYAMLANKQEQQALREVIENDESGYKEKFSELMPALDAARACNEDIACWIKKLEDKDPVVVHKAAYMLGRLGRGNQKAIDALVEQLDHSKIEVRLAAVAALDRIAVEGAPKAVAKIQDMREEEEGRSIWTQFRREALPIQARLRARAQG